MDQVRVKIRGIVATERYGTLESGYVLPTDAAYARFLVEECKAGEYVNVASPAESPDVSRNTVITRQRKGSKA